MFVSAGENVFLGVLRHGFPALTDRLHHQWPHPATLFGALRGIRILSLEMCDGNIDVVPVNFASELKGAGLELLQRMLAEVSTACAEWIRKQGPWVALGFFHAAP